MQPLVTNLVGSVHAVMNNKEFLQPVWLMIDRRNERMMPMHVPFEDAEDKQIAAHLIRTLVLAQQPHVDAVIFMCEAWKKDYQRGEPGFEDRTSAVRDRPGREDVIMIMVETYDGVWVAQPVVSGEPGKDRELADVNFEFIPMCEGQMGNYLPPRNKKDIN
jgi:hypothetical protein